MSHNSSTAVVATLLLCAVQAIYAQGAGGIERGVKVYSDQKGSACHSISGKGNAQGVLVAYMMSLKKGAKK